MCYNYSRWYEMALFDKFRKKNNEEAIQYEENKDIIGLTNYMLADVRREDVIDNSLELSLAKLKEASPLGIPIAEAIGLIIDNKAGNKLYKITNLGINDSLSFSKKEGINWGTIKKVDGTKTMAKLKEVNPEVLNPSTIMLAAVLYSVERELGQIKEISKEILSFLENEKQAEIEADLELLRRAVEDFKYNIDNEKYMEVYHNQVMNILRTSNKNLIGYKNDIKNYLAKGKLFTTGSSMKSIMEEMFNKFKYYRLSLFIYSFATYIEIFITGNKNSEYLLHKEEELKNLVKEYSDEYEKAMSYIKKNANKSLEGNILSGLGSAGKTIGNMAHKVKAKGTSDWLNEKGDSLKHSGETIKQNYSEMFEEMKDTNAVLFIKQIDNINSICNNTSEIYFDKERIYLQKKTSN